MIFDLKGLSMSLWNKTTISMFKKIVSISEEVYPECLGKMIVLNAPFIFTAIWNMIRSLIDEKTRNKISIYGSNYYPKLLEFFDED